MDKASSSRLPLRLLLVMVALTGSLMVHILIENLSPMEKIVAIEMSEHGGVLDRTHNDSEDSFVLPNLTGAAQNTGGVSQIPSVLLPLINFSILPVLPPPKFS